MVLLYHISHIDNVEKDNDVLEVHFIEMNNFLKTWQDDSVDTLNDILARWLLLLDMVDVRKDKIYEDINKDYRLRAPRPVATSA